MNHKSAILTIALALVGLTGCNRRQAPESQAPTVKTDTVAAQAAEFEIVYPGKTVAASEANVAFRIAGPIKRIPVEVGQYVRRGEVIAELDPRDYRLQLTATEAEYQKVKAEAERVIELYKRGSATSNDYDKARYGLEQITQKYEACKNAMADVTLRAPFDGYVQKRFFQAGEIVNAGMPVVALTSKSDVELVIHIPADDYQRRDRFTGYTARSDMYPGIEYRLEPVGFAPKANLNQLYEVRLRLTGNYDVRPTAGVSMNVGILYRPDANSLVRLPLSALFEHEGASAVWVVDPASSTVKLRTVEPAKIYKDGTVALRSGLAAGDIVVTAGVHALSDGQTVRILPPASRTNVGGML
jgi:RND family efflux transporter MFP subunit